MVACFAAENRLASIVGKKRAANVLGQPTFRVGGGYWLRLPVFSWFTSKGVVSEANGVDPSASRDLKSEPM